MITLEPTVEFEPLYWMDDEEEEVLDKIGTDEWDTYWDSFLETIGIVPISAGSWFISVDELEEAEVIKKLLSLVCKSEPSIEEQAKKLAPFNGGYMLFEKDKVLFSPQCCCDLGDLSYWKEVSDLASENWHNLSMGHAMMYARKIDNQLEIKEIPEYGNSEPIIEKIDPTELQTAIVNAEQKINLFKERIAITAEKMFNNKKVALKISERLTGQL